MNSSALCSLERNNRTAVKNPFLELEQLSFVFADGRMVLQNISLQIYAGDFVCLVGPSGVGKSTLLRILAGLLPPTSGELRWRDSNGNSAPEAIGLMFQRDNLMPWRTAAHNVRLPLEILGGNSSLHDERVQELLELVGLSGFENNYPAQLSGGMAQRVALARALVHRPSLLLLDEPFGALDSLTRERMGQELLRIRQVKPVTVFMVTHSIHEAVFLADRVQVMGQTPATITHQIPIPLPRPRQIAMQHSAPFLQGVQQVRTAIESLSPAD
jgi:NitT/TauT family transport system ATP-binding protein